MPSPTRCYASLAQKAARPHSLQHPTEPMSSAMQPPKNAIPKLSATLVQQTHIGKPE